MRDLLRNVKFEIIVCVFLQLVGKAEAPVPEGVIVTEVTAKAPHTLLLKVANWLHKPQRFKVWFRTLYQGYKLGG